MKYITLLLGLTLTLGFVSCKKSHNTDDPLPCDGELMLLKDRSGLDGCTWVFEKDSTQFEPTNLDSFDVPLRDQQLYYVEYDTINAMSICMVGPVIEVTCLEPLLLEPHD